MPTEGGFEVYLRDPIRRDIDISGSEPTNLLSTRQRFSFAHEIAHTYYYKLSGSVPISDHAISNTMDLEDSCNQTAGRILVPTALLRREIKKKIGDPENIDSAFVRSAATSFRTSIPVIIERLRFAEPSNPFERCVVLVKRLEGDAQIRASYFGIGLLPILPRPRKYTRVTEWLADFPRPAIANREDSDWRVTRGGRLVSFMKTELGGGTDFLLQVQVATSQ